MSRSNHEHGLDSLDRALRHFEEKIAPSPVERGITVRVVGEFSSGKTRLFRELLEGRVPDPLLPLSSLQPQTLLPLELAWGDDVALSLIEKPQDAKEGEVRKALSKFPTRAEIQAMEAAPGRDRLRLTLPEPSLQMQFSGSDAPVRLSLIDTPGWASGDQDPSLDDLEYAFQPAVVYVCSQERLDSSANIEHLRSLLDTLTQEANYLTLVPDAKIQLVLCVTHFEKGAHSSAHLEGFRATLRSLLEDPSYCEVELGELLTVDFEQVTDSELAEFRRRFWKTLRSIPGVGDEGRAGASASSEVIGNWEGEFFDYLLDIEERLGRAAAFADWLVSCEKVLPHMNRTRLQAHPKKTWPDKLERRWRSGQSSQHIPSADSFDPLPTLPEEHPMARWWEVCFAPEVAQALNSGHVLIETLQQAMADYPSVDGPLNEYLLEQAWTVLPDALRSIKTAQAYLPDSLCDLIKADDQRAAAVATLLSISLARTLLRDSMEANSEQLPHELGSISTNPFVDG